MYPLYSICFCNNHYFKSFSDREVGIIAVIASFWHSHYRNGTIQISHAKSK